uniref:Uncharacterized protein n=1 Tax=Panagrolaimus sp. JU765 TaxID=591449 RepID=A0AC34QD15_9BILA
MADSFKPRIPQWVDLRNPEPVDDVSFFEQRALELGTPLKKQNILPLANQIQELKIYSGTEVDVAKLSKNAAPGSYGDLASLALLNPGKNQIAERARRRSQQITLEPEKAKGSTTDSESKNSRRRSGITSQPAVVRQNSFVSRRSSSSIRAPMPAVSGPITRRRASVEASRITQSVNPENSASKPVSRVLANVGPSQMTLRPRTGIIVSQREAQKSAGTAKRPEILPRRRSVNRPVVDANVDSKKTTVNVTSAPVSKTAQNPTPRLTSTKINLDDQENILPLANQVQILKIHSSTEVDIAKLTKNAAPGSFGDLSSLALLNPGKNQIAERARRRSQQLKVSSVCEPAHASKTSSVSIKQGTVEKKPEKVILPPPKRQPFGNNLRTYSPPTGTTPRKTVTIPKPFPPPRRSASHCRGIDPTAHLYPA